MEVPEMRIIICWGLFWGLLFMYTHNYIYIYMCVCIYIHIPRSDIGKDAHRIPKAPSTSCSEITEAS